ncbi:EamA family transporter [Candidatus Woesearchaeota archaeon]|nr:EamA family transporter [Candidatus Woesearchaeota archaeon]
MYWIIFALLEPFFHGFANVIDNHFTNNLFKKTTTLVFFASFTNILFLPIIFLLDFPSFITPSQIPFFIILGLTGIGYLYPYYKALQNDDTSIVVSLFSLGKIFVPLLAFLLVGEILAISQYIGFFVVILSATLLTLNGKQKFRLNNSFFWMILCTLIISFEVVIYKYIFNIMSWGTGFTWATLFSFMFALPLIFIKKTRNGIFSQVKTFKNNFKLFAFEEFLTFSGSAVTSFQPIVVLLYALTLGRFFPKFFKEDITTKNLIKKIILFVIMVLGVIIILS